MTKTEQKFKIESVVILIIEYYLQCADFNLQSIVLYELLIKLKNKKNGFNELEPINIKLSLSQCQALYDLLIAYPIPENSTIIVHTLVAALDQHLKNIIQIKHHHHQTLLL